MQNPDNCRFTKTHEWISSDGSVGISDHAQKEITDVVFVELPKVGREVKARDPIAVVESVKAAFDIYSPVSGKIVKVNQAVSLNPALLNTSPYGDGWLFTIQKSNPSEEQNLMKHDQYQEFIKTSVH